MIRLIQLIALLLALYLAGETHAAFGFSGNQEWNQWRGPSRDGQVASPGWPDRLTENYLQPSLPAGIKTNRGFTVSTKEPPGSPLKKLGRTPRKVIFPRRS